MNWDDIARAAGTDKASWIDDGHGGRRDGHGYMYAYEDALWGRTITSIVEIGVDKGASLRAWSMIWPHADILGIDIDPACERYAAGNVRVLTANVTDDTQLEPIRGDEWDLIVDDGSHRREDIISALPFFVPRLRSGGIYAIEDVILGPSVWPASLKDLLPPVYDAGLRIVSVTRSGIPFVQGGTHMGEFGLVLAEKP